MQWYHEKYGDSEVIGKKGAAVNAALVHCWGRCDQALCAVKAAIRRRTHACFYMPERCGSCSCEKDSVQGVRDQPKELFGKGRLKMSMYVTKLRAKELILLHSKTMRLYATLLRCHMSFSITENMPQK